MLSIAVPTIAFAGVTTVAWHAAMHELSRATCSGGVARSAMRFDGSRSASRAPLQTPWAGSR